MPDITLQEQRCLFTLLAAQLIIWVHETMPGYELAMDQVKRTQSDADANAKNGVGIPHSLHLLGLAVDFDLYVDGHYATVSEAHRPIGERWKSMNPLCRWGGDFTTKDGNHYSTTRDGIQ